MTVVIPEKKRVPGQPRPRAALFVALRAGGDGQSSSTLLHPTPPNWRRRYKPWSSARQANDSLH